MFVIIKKGEIVGTKGVSQNHLLSFDNNKVLKSIYWICWTFVQVYRIIIKVLFIEILIEQVKEQRNFIWSLDHLEECVWRMHLKNCVWSNESEEELLKTRHQKQWSSEAYLIRSYFTRVDKGQCTKCTTTNSAIFVSTSRQR